MKEIVYRKDDERMRMKKLAAILLAVTMLCGMLSGMSLASVSAATITSGYDKAMNQWLLGIDTWDTFRKENYIVCYQYGYDAKDSWYKDYYTGPNRTATNPWGFEIAVNKYGYVTVIEDGVGNMAIPEGGYVLSGNGTGEQRMRDAVNNGALKVGDRVQLSDGSNSQYRVMRVTDDDKLLGDNVTFCVPWADLNKNYEGTVTLGGNGAKTGTSYWQNYLLCKQTGTNGTYPSGYAVKMINASVEIPEGYFAVTLPGQTFHDTGKPAYNAAQFLKEYASAGAVVSGGTDGLFFRYDAAAAVRAAQLLTGTDGMTYDFSASTIYGDALKNFELVDTDRMGELYNNMVAITNEISADMTVDALRPYLATLYQNYDELCKLEYEVRTVEMRATWLRPLPNDGKERTEEELDQLLTDYISNIKDMGYNMIFVEAFYNSTTIFPIPANVGYNGLSFNQNPYLVPVSEGGLNNNLTERYDMLKRFIEICGEYNVEPHIWWEVFYVGYERTNGATDALFDYSVAKTIMNNPSAYKNWLNKGSNGDLFYGAAGDGALQYFLNPASTGARTFLMNTFKYIWSTYDVNSFQLDYIRYPHTTAEKCFGYDDDTLAAFKASTYYDAAVHTDAYLKSYDGFFDEDWVQFRADYVTSFVKEVKDTMYEIAPDIYLTSSPGAEPEESKANLMQDVTYWLQNDYIDIIFPMAYGENVPGHVSAGLVADNSEHFVCTGVSGSYLDNDMEARWMKEVRDAGTDGLATFVDIPDYVDYVWSKPAITPTGNATLAAITYINDTMKARIDQMQKLGVEELEELRMDLATVEREICVYGLDYVHLGSSLERLIDTAAYCGADVEAAVAKDVKYLTKIRNNSRDNATELRELANDTFTVNGKRLTDDGNGFYYNGAMKTLYITEYASELSGTLSGDVTILLPEIHNRLTLNNVHTAGSFHIQTEDDMFIKLVGENLFDGGFTCDTTVTYYGFGASYGGGEHDVRMADIDSDMMIDSTDVRRMLAYAVKAEEFNEYQLMVADVDGNGKVNTIDTRKVLAFTLGLAA